MVDCLFKRENSDYHVPVRIISNWCCREFEMVPDVQKVVVMRTECLVL